VIKYDDLIDEYERKIFLQLIEVMKKDTNMIRPCSHAIITSQASGEACRPLNQYSRRSDFSN